MWEVDLDSWWRTMEVNVRGVLIGTQLVLPDMVARGARPDHQHDEPGRRVPLADGVRVLGVEGRSREADGEPRARDARHGVSVFSVHPGLLPIGMSDAASSGPAAADAYEARIRSWVTRELSEGRGADPAAAIALVMFLATGSADALSGRARLRPRRHRQRCSSTSTRCASTTST